MKEPDDNTILRATEILTGAQNGDIEGLVCICFMQNGSINVQVAGEQPMLVRLGALVVASDAIKLLETQLQIQRQQQANWGPGGNA